MSLNVGEPHLKAGEDHLNLGETCHEDMERVRSSVFLYDVLAQSV